MQKVLVGPFIDALFVNEACETNQVDSEHTLKHDVLPRLHRVIYDLIVNSVLDYNYGCDHHRHQEGKHNAAGAVLDIEEPAGVPHPEPS